MPKKGMQTQNRKPATIKFQLLFFFQFLPHAFNVPIDKFGDIDFYRRIWPGQIMAGFYAAEIIFTKLQSCSPVILQKSDNRSSV